MNFKGELPCRCSAYGSPLQCSCLDSPMDGGAWWAVVHGAAEADATEAARQQSLQFAHAFLHHSRTVTSKKWLSEGSDSCLFLLKLKP